ncbi:response regulator [Salsipaludibacter albus]|uniref:response regulator n=1 Tax=Salsipaludibacter albus TaxID=2849650 RepID=UPI001EE42F80|nr:response regulator transcription factor [Salsipaludibacter albus]MBY5160991.1 response regulator transcription factor [Salsipaludibacter albus]
MTTSEPADTPEDAADTPATIRVMLVDDHEIVRQGLASLLEATDDLEVVVEAGTAEEAVARAKVFEPDVVVMDVRLPDGNGVDACRDIRAHRPETRVLMLTSFSDDQALFDSIMAGAAGYVLKQVRGTELADSIRRVGRGESILDPAVTKRVLERIRNPDEDKDERLARLTPTEERILDMIADGRTNREIAERIHLAEKTIKNYVSGILSKLEVSRRVEAAAYLVEQRTRERRSY